MYKKLIKEWLFLASISGLIVTSIATLRIPNYTLNDMLIIYTLFIFLCIVKGLEKTGVVDKISYKFSKGKYLKLKLIILTAILSMLITNDMALISIVPLTLALKIENVEDLIILETITANVASAVSPIGNPQNIFIYYFYNLKITQFVKAVFPLVSILLIFMRI